MKDKIIKLSSQKIKECLYEKSRKYSAAQIRNIEIYVESIIDHVLKQVEEVVATEMDNKSTLTTNAEFIACDDLAINIIKRLNTLK